MKTLFTARTIRLLATALLLGGLFAGCSETGAEKYDRWMSELDCPVVLIGKTDKASNRPSIVVRDGAGRVRTMATDNGNGWRMPEAISASRIIGDTLKPCTTDRR